MRLNSSKYIHFWHDCQMNIKSIIILSSLCLTPPLCVPQQPLRRHWSVRGHTIRSHGPFPLPDFGSSNRSTMCFLMMSSSSSVNTLLFPPLPFHSVLPFLIMSLSDVWGTPKASAHWRTETYLPAFQAARARDARGRFKSRLQIQRQWLKSSSYISDIVSWGGPIRILGCHLGWF